MCITQKSAKLILEDNLVFEGTSFGFPQSRAGEVVFNTGMVGYPEALTDPSYKGQILTFTFPLIGNYGIPSGKQAADWNRYFESMSGMVSGLIVSDYSDDHHHWNADTSLANWLYNQKIPAITGIDTRALTRHIRESGVMLGKIVIDDKDVELYDPNIENLVEQVSISEPTIIGEGKKRILLIDCGCKHSIIKELSKRDVEILRVPWNYPIRDEKFDGLLISSGPGDPKMCKETTAEVQWAIEQDKPTLGICLGHQLMALAVGGDTYKMSYGHRSQNQPVISNSGQKSYITSQNHGFAVDVKSLPKGWSALFKNLNDDTCEGLIHISGKFMSSQFHPEASPGPVDTSFLFDQFMEIVK
ncbi:MAG: glutamine-hydrolyzing carbamoyl-phosphate synthase small subunit [Calditrichaceae bacterium]